MSKSKIIGGVLLIVGTSIGGGMLALPVSTAAAGFSNSLFFLVLCWLIMTSGAVLMLEVISQFPRGSNIITMAKATLGLPGQIIAWLLYLILLYTLLSAYISGGSDVFSGLLHKIQINIPDWLTSLIFTSIFGMVVFCGIRAVDYVNRGLMFGKLGVYLLLVFIIAPHIEPTLLQGGSIVEINASLMILITSFGFASIIPSLRDYFDNDIASLKKVIIFGSLVPLVCYVLWDAVIMGVISREGDMGLMALLKADKANSGLILALKDAVNSSLITGFFSFFTSICMLTAFLGVSLGLYDFLADGLKLAKQGKHGLILLALTFLPPLAIVLINPGVYLHALAYAGICCVILLLLLPVLMAWRLRQKTSNNATQHSVMLLPGGKLSLSLLSITATILLIKACLP